MFELYLVTMVDYQVTKVIFCSQGAYKDSIPSLV